jgi:hypothetical protein
MAKSKLHRANQAIVVFVLFIFGHHGVRGSDIIHDAAITSCDCTYSDGDVTSAA